MPAPASALTMAAARHLHAQNQSAMRADEKEKLNGDFVRAAEMGDTHTVRKLLGLGADIEFRLTPTLGIFNNQTILSEVEFVLHELGYDIDGGEIHLSKRTALQAAADGSHGDVLRLLVDSGANLNPIPARLWGRSALQGAVDCEDESLVQLLLDNGANANEPLTEASRLTALQGAARKGNEILVQLLLVSGADVNACAQEEDGKTALEAAVESENEKLVQNLILAGADIVGDALERWLCTAAADGLEKRTELILTLKPDNGALGTALIVAGGMGDQSIVELLLNAMVSEPLQPTMQGDELSMAPVPHPGLAVRDELGQNIVHIACRAGNIDLVGFLLKIATLDMLNARNHDGSTTLHNAVGANSVPMIELLMDCGVNLETTDRSGKSALQYAMSFGYDDLSGALLERGAKTDGMSFKLAKRVLEVCGSTKSDEGMMLLQSGSAKGTRLVGVSADNIQIQNIHDIFWSLPSFCFAGPSAQCPPRTTSEEFVKPSHFLVHYPIGRESKTMVNWAWSVIGKSGFVLGIPTARDLEDTGADDIFLVPYFYFDCPVQASGNDSRVAQLRRDRDLQPFQTIETRAQISWIMRKGTRPASGSPDWLRSISYRCSFPPQYLAIPADGAEFVVFFVEEIRTRWKVFFESAIHHITTIRTIQLYEGGKNSEVIKCLLTDTQEWQTLRNTSNEHMLAISGIVHTFRSNPILNAELMREDDTTDPNLRTLPGATLARLTELVALLKEECAQGLLKLDSQTKEMIELEFNLVSIYEARRSIDMSASMKRLSWITFIFLPLMFVSSLFGMNVNLLTDDPGWQWYLVVSIPFMALVVGIWVLCKYLYDPVLNFVERYRHPRSNDEERGRYRMLERIVTIEGDEEGSMLTGSLVD